MCGAVVGERLVFAIGSLSLNGTAPIPIPIPSTSEDAWRWAELEAIHTLPRCTIPSAIRVPGRMWLYVVVRVESRAQLQD